MVATVQTPLTQIDDVIATRFGTSFSDWILDVVASLRGSCGTLPLSAEVVASELGIKVVADSSSASFGSTVRLGDGAFEIRVGSDLDAQQRNFTIAHELGHVFLFRASNGTLIDGDEVEHASDLFGAHLLVPLQHLDSVLRASGARLATLRRLAEYCNMPILPLGILVARYYPVSFWWRRAAYLEWTGAFDPRDFLDVIESCSADGECSVERRMAGVDRWTVEAMSDGTVGGLGLLKPRGRGSKDVLTVRCINLPREQLLGHHGGEEWMVHAEFSQGCRP